MAGPRHPAAMPTCRPFDPILPMTHPLDAALLLEPLGDGRFRGRTSPDYWNMVGPYGGITAALCQRAVLDDPRHLGEPLALTVNYCAAIAEGEFTIELDFVRSGRTTQHVAIRLVQPDPRTPGRDGVVIQAMAVMGVRRDVWGRTQATPPTAPPPAGLERRQPRAGIRWLERFDSRYLKPLTKAPAPDEIVLDWVRDDPLRPLDYPALASLADSFYPAIYAMIGKRIPIATVSMNTYFHAGAADLAAVGSDYLLGATRSQVFEAGFFDCESQLWHGERLLATTQQVVWYRED